MKPYHVYFQNFCTQSGYHAEEDVDKGGDHSLEDLAKSGYKINIKYEALITLLYFGYTLKSKYRHQMILAFFPLTSSD
jgi:hypothetical protein